MDEKIHLDFIRVLAFGFLSLIFSAQPCLSTWYSWLQNSCECLGYWLVSKLFLRFSLPTFILLDLYVNSVTLIKCFSDQLFPSQATALLSGQVCPFFLPQSSLFPLIILNSSCNIECSVKNNFCMIIWFLSPI